MSVVSIFSGAFCGGREVARAVAQRLACPLLDDSALLAQVNWQPSQPRAAGAQAIFQDLTLFDAHPRERDRLLARLRQGMAQLLERDNLVYLDYGAVAAEGLTPEEAAERIRQADQQAMAWVGLLQGRQVWSSGIYDILVPMDKQGLPETVDLIMEHARSVMLMPNKDSLQAVQDFALASRVETVLADGGLPTRDLHLGADRGRMLITSKEGAVLDLQQGRLIASLAGQVPGVDPERLEVRLAGPGQAPEEEALPAQVLLVDDEHDFVQTLSERLLMRQINSLVVYDGQ